MDLMNKDVLKDLILIIEISVTSTRLPRRVRFIITNVSRTDTFLRKSKGPKILRRKSKSTVRGSVQWIIK